MTFGNSLVHISKRNCLMTGVFCLVEHLATCSDCAGRLKELQRLFDVFDRENARLTELMPSSIEMMEAIFNEMEVIRQAQPVGK